ncbi:hypothetical protein [Allobranchiibius sp. CTAmp26]|uniref:sialidase family protein n=1 Tax=Allobranchiibius sp. CTAmp26 TaxID=2815214 RepID=UPI001AA0DD88|nr:hypothetical protein [Allobranchiibius sp. CTAmp26]MBO1755367.1 hypothetical protein [Allobranchiibius sp. CTAmp26]
MNDDDLRGSGEDRREPAYDDDPVARFFGAHRSSVRPETAGDLDWARITRAARRRRPHRFLAGAVAAAAVAVVAGFGVWTVQAPQSNGPAVAASSVSSTSVRSGTQAGGARQPQHDSGTPVTPGAQSQAQPRVVVPDSFVTWSLSNAGNNVVYDLGSSSCGAFTCPVLLRSADNGASWSGVHTFDGSLYSSPVQPGGKHIQPDDQLRDVRFVTPTTGYVFGGDLWVTHDSGASFSRVAHPGRTVLDVEAWHGDLLVLTADKCASSTCAGSVSLTRMSTSADTVPQAASSTADLTAPIVSGQIVVRNGMAYLSLTSASDGAPLPPLRLVNTSLEPMYAPGACAGTSLQAITPSTTLNHQLFALCTPMTGASRTSYTLVHSTDDGVTWTKVSSGALQLPTGSRPDLASVDADHVAASAGPTTTTGAAAVVGAGSLVVSTDGGKTFVAKDGPLGLPASGIDWLASPGGSQYYAITLSSSGYWWSNDSGLTWRLVDPIR